MTELRWFKPKNFGYGIAIASWQGAVVTAVWCLLIVLATMVLRRVGPLATGAVVVLLFAALLMLANRTGAKGWWRSYRP